MTNTEVWEFVGTSCARHQGKEHVRHAQIRAQARVLQSQLQGCEARARAQEAQLQSMDHDDSASWRMSDSACTFPNAGAPMFQTSSTTLIQNWIPATSHAASWKKQAAFDEQRRKEHEQRPIAQSLVTEDFTREQVRGILDMERRNW